MNNETYRGVEHINDTLSVDVAIIGGGAAGCLLAIALGEAGLSVALLERSERLPFNGGDFLKPPGLAVLRRHGLERPLLEVGLRRQQIRYFHDGEELFTYDYAEHTQQGHYLIVPYATLMESLIERMATLDSVSVYTGVGTARTVWESDRVERVALEGGASVRAQVVVGADGSRSRVRAAIGAPESPQPCEQQVYMAHLPMVESVAALNRLYLSSARWFTYLYPMDRQRFRLTIGAPAGESLQRFAGSTTNLVEHLRTFTSESDDALAIVDSLDSFDSFMRLPIASLHVSRYSRGNAVLVGDAAHLGHPVTGQGMNLALEDSDALARALISWSSGQRSLDQALRGYQDERWSINECTLSYGRDLLRRYEDRSYYLAHFDPAIHGGVRPVARGKAPSQGVYA